MDSELLKLLTDYVLTAVFLVLFVRSQLELVKVHQQMAEQRREENREMRGLLFELARRGIREHAEDTGQIRQAYARAQVFEKPE